MAQCVGSRKPHPAEEHRAHRGRAPVHRRARRPGAKQGRRSGPVRSPAQGVEVFSSRREAVLNPAGRLRNPTTRSDDDAVLPGVGTPRREAGHHGREAGPLPALLLDQAPRRRPRRAARSSCRVRRRARCSPVPRRRERRDGSHPRQAPSVGFQ